MKIRLLTIISLSLLTFFSCDDDDNTGFQTEDVSISMGANYGNDIYYSLSNGVVATVNRTEWDIAFGVSARSSSILINEGAMVELKVHSQTDTWVAEAIDTAGYSSDMPLYNGDSDWEEGAFGANATDHPDYGWGTYDMATHNVNGSTKYIIKLRNGDFKQIFIEQKKAMELTYVFHFANIDGTGAQSVNLDVSSAKANFVYYNLETNTELDREPDASTWDLVFTKWIDNDMYYPVSGVLQNAGVLAIEIESEDLSGTAYFADDFSDDIDKIGADFKDIDHQTYQFYIPDNKYYFVKDKSENVFKIVFTSFEGQSTGNIGFKLTKI